MMKNIEKLFSNQHYYSGTAWPPVTPHGRVGERQAARQRRQGLHNTVINGFEIMQTLPSRERTPS